MACIVIALYSYGLYSYGPISLWPYIAGNSGEYRKFWAKPSRLTSDLLDFCFGCSPWDLAKSFSVCIRCNGVMPRQPWQPYYGGALDACHFTYLLTWHLLCATSAWYLSRSLHSRTKLSILRMWEKIWGKSAKNWLGTTYLKLGESFRPAGTWLLTYVSSCRLRG